LHPEKSSKRKHKVSFKVTHPVLSRWGKWGGLILFCVALFWLPAQAQTVLPKITIGVDKAASPQDLTVTLQILLMMTVLALAPSILILMTAFTRIVMVLHFLRQALGTQQMPPNQVVIGLALFLTFFVMSPTIDRIYENAWKPLQEEKITTQQALDNAGGALKDFMLAQTRQKDLALFISLAHMDKPNSPRDLPLKVVVPGFIISELRIGFQIGFLIYLPFLIIDMVVSSILMSMGMLMLPPVMVSLPFKLLLFVLVDGWYLMVKSLVEGFVGVP
jgi:flagellar biosynthetic protein FliP